MEVFIHITVQTRSPLAAPRPPTEAECGRKQMGTQRGPDAEPVNSLGVVYLEIQMMWSGKKSRRGGIQFV